MDEFEGTARQFSHFILFLRFL